MKRVIILGVLGACMTVLLSGAFGQARENVRFAPGTHGTKLPGTVRGFAYRDYIVRASGGQTMKVNLDASKGATVFTIFLPNGDNLAGASETDNFTGKLPANGEYKIRVAMMRSAARRRGSVSNFTLRINIK